MMLVDQQLETAALQRNLWASRPVYMQSPACKMINMFALPFLLALQPSSQHCQAACLVLVRCCTQFQSDEVHSLFSPTCKQLNA